MNALNHICSLILNSKDVGQLTGLVPNACSGGGLSIKADQLW